MDEHYGCQMYAFTSRTWWDLRRDGADDAAQRERLDNISAGGGASGSNYRDFTVILYSLTSKA
ncbi:hypothetical protein OK016_14485 [Vibrio chagasii]|nr:hypothetical protein [Vibrio chagasii]